MPSVGKKFSNEEVRLLKKKREDAKDRAVAKKRNYNRDIFELGSRVGVCDVDKLYLYWKLGSGA